MKTLMIIAMGLVIGGCSSQPRPELGSSVRAMTEQQTYNPAATQQNASRDGNSLDGESGVHILRTYRQAVGQPREVKKEIQVNIGN
ncbi:hypothetical protein [Aliamphritea hakodatensis]|uniref:hypothetical protein n=1 Tax=Aliamphritea hakodatensis TaxID=2895352 RepID=UPI0022FD8575|nr:hypothetical protein [Aliamphritea hakodatensis]